MSRGYTELAQVAQQRSGIAPTAKDRRRARRATVHASADIISLVVAAEAHLDKYEKFPAAVHLEEVRSALRRIQRMAVFASQMSTSAIQQGSMTR